MMGPASQISYFLAVMSSMINNVNSDIFNSTDSIISSVQFTTLEPPHSKNSSLPPRLRVLNDSGYLSWRDSHLRNYEIPRLEENDFDDEITTTTMHNISDFEVSTAETPDDVENEIVPVEEETHLELMHRAPVYQGRQIMMEDYPYVATIWLRYTKPEYHAVGTLISTRHVLTAAHSICWNVDTGVPVPFNNLMMGVRVGTSNLNESFVEHDVLYSYIHWKWWASNRRNRLYDVAVLEIKEEIQLTPRSALVYLTSPLDIDLLVMMKSNRPCVSVWWGHQTPQDPLYPYLQVAQMNLITYSECNHLLAEYNEHSINTAIELCTSTQSAEGPCQTSTGGPLICEGKQIGILSWGASCMKSRKPLVYTRTDVLFPWIRRQMKLREGRYLHMMGGSKKLQTSSLITIVIFVFALDVT